MLLQRQTVHCNAISLLCVTRVCIGKLKSWIHVYVKLSYVFRYSSIDIMHFVDVSQSQSAAVAHSPWLDTFRVDSDCFLLLRFSLMFFLQLWKMCQLRENRKINSFFFCLFEMSSPWSINAAKLTSSISHARMICVNDMQSQMQSKQVKFIRHCKVQYLLVVFV